MPDGSNGYENIAEAFIRTRRSWIGPTVVRKWAAGLRTGASILDVGCGSGVPISEALLQDGFTVYGVDASATLIAKFRERFPGVPLECSTVEESRFFNRKFDAANMTGLHSFSLGHHAYQRELEAHGFRLVGNDVDEGDNYYYFAAKR